MARAYVIGQLNVYNDESMNPYRCTIIFTHPARSGEYTKCIPPKHYSEPRGYQGL